ncbi:hypothetical protein C0J52_26594 [Blattella germanica]|nr:hypothetical protein C0J52_26594 [Blattella germanica]
MHLKDTRRLTCQKCKQLFSDASSLQSHMTIHTYDCPYSCDVCDQKFVLNTSLKKHVLIHAEKAPYCCNICKKKKNIC